VPSTSFKAKMIYKGYIDDPRNTDNAWVEAEIWNIHYKGQDKFNDHISDVSLLDYDLDYGRCLNFFLRKPS
jgi:hypothetical protein